MIQLNRTHDDVAGVRASCFSASSMQFYRLSSTLLPGDERPSAPFFLPNLDPLDRVNLPLPLRSSHTTHPPKPSPSLAPACDFPSWQKSGSDLITSMQCRSGVQAPLPMPVLLGRCRGGARHFEGGLRHECLFSDEEAATLEAKHRHRSLTPYPRPSTPDPDPRTLTPYPLPLTRISSK